MRNALRRGITWVMAMALLLLPCAVAGAEVVSDEAATLQLFYWESAYTEPLKEAIKGFQQMYPNVNIEIEVPAGDFETVLLTRIMSGESPDLFMYYGSSVFKMAQNGYWGPLDESAEWVSRVTPAFLENMKYDGQIYAYPFDCSVEGVFYNKTVFEQNGIQVPTTYDEFLAACETLKASGITPIAIGAKDTWTSYHAFSVLNSSINTLYHEDFGTKLYDGEITFQDSAYGEVLGTYSELYQQGYFGEGVLGIDLNQAAQNLASGKAGMMMLSSYLVSVLQGMDTQDEFGFFAFPNEKGESALVAYVDKAIGYSPSGKNVDLSKAFINYLGTPEVTRNILSKIKALPCASGVEWDMNTALQETYDATTNHNLYAFFDAFWPGSVNTVLDKGISAVLSGSPDIDGVLGDMQEAYEEDKDTVIRPMLVY